MKEIPVTENPELDLIHTDIASLLSKLESETDFDTENILMERIFRMMILHSVSEDKMLKEYWYDGADKHKKDSYEFMMNMSLVHGHFNSLISTKSQYFDFVYNWLVQHIENHDMRFAQYIRSCQGEKKHPFPIHDCSKEHRYLKCC